MFRFIAGLFVSVLLITAFTMPSLAQAKTTVTQATPKASAMPEPALSVPEFVVTAGPGKFPPGSPLHFLDSFVDNMKLWFKSKDGVLIKRADIADKKLMQMKLAIHDHNLGNLKSAAQDYNKQMAAINMNIKDRNLPDNVRVQLLNRIRDDEKSFGFLYAMAQDSMVQTLQDVSQALQTAKNSVH